MNVGDIMQELLLYAFEFFVIAMMMGLLKNSKNVTIQTDAGSGKYITLLFCGVSLFLIVKERTLFYVIQGAVVFIVGLCYLKVRSGFASNGIVIMGKLYKKENIKEIMIENQNNVFRVSFKYNKKFHYLYVNHSDIKKIEDAVRKF